MTTKGNKLYVKLLNDAEKEMNIKASTKTATALSRMLILHPRMLEKLKKMSDKEFDRIIKC